MKEVVREHLAALQTGRSNYVGKRTHYLNPTLPKTEKARNTWARDYQSWPHVGSGRNVHYFGSPDRLSIPDYRIYYEPAPMEAESVDPHANRADQAAAYARIRSRAPMWPVDRTFHSELSDRRLIADTLGGQGFLGLDGRRTFAEPNAERFAAMPISKPGLSADQMREWHARKQAQEPAQEGFLTRLGETLADWGEGVGDLLRSDPPAKKGPRLVHVPYGGPVARPMPAGPISTPPGFDVLLPDEAPIPKPRLGGLLGDHFLAPGRDRQEQARSGKKRDKSRAGRSPW